MPADRIRTKPPSAANGQAGDEPTNGRSQGEDGGRDGGRQETRQALLAAASRLFAEQGYTATTDPQIVRAAGVGHGTFYQYFDSRRSILVAVTHEAQRAHMQRPEV